MIDFVNWNPDTNLTIYAYKFPETNLSTYTQLVVQESQEAVLFSKGQIIGKFGPGKHTLNTENLPLLRSFYGIPFRNNASPKNRNPFTAEIWFVNKLQPYNINWEIDKMDIHDADYNTGIPLVANGTYGLRIIDAERFLVRIVGTKTYFNEEDLTDQFWGEFSTKTKSTLMQFMIKNKIGLKQISAYLDTISEHLHTIMLPFWENIGFELTKFYVTNIEVDKKTTAGMRIIEAISRQSAQAIGGYTWQQSQAFEVAKEVVDGISHSDSGLLGAIVASNMVGGLSGGNSLAQPQQNQTTFGPNNTGKRDEAAPAMPREIYCSNCSKKFANNLKFCPFCGDEYSPCPKCGTDNDKNAKRCVSCGQQLVMSQSYCPNCNTPIVDGTSFCGSCGKPVSEGNCTRCGAQLSLNIKFCPKCGQKNG